MKRIVLLAVCALFTITSVSAQDAKKKKGKETVTFFIEAMDCDHCVKKIEKNISFEKGVTDLKCDLSTRTAMVTYRSDKTTEENLTGAFKKIGMEAISVEEGAEIAVPKAEKSGHQHQH
ncbi:heavy-metal-associated domain-containing protein [Parabacteroides sp. PF5-9]|uniref:heavy-metal-associated domain-containing protein n=1 Tax=Parabacteroides sp. PF5-9 TaxID=1742404 RepID=UPI002475151F|nr:heavy-metal-associated domain-containing protein [Parabacteroides sp. PF5-9]MDH6357175.1 mercuric ion binding protein [Parabacteroides sp. PF5-9]